MRVIVKDPGKSPVQITTDGSLQSLHRIIGGYIEHVRFTDDVGILVDEEGKLKGLAPNFFLPAIEDELVGTVVFVGEDGEEFVDVSENDAQLIMKTFEIPIGKEARGQ